MMTKLQSLLLPVTPQEKEALERSIRERTNQLGGSVLVADENGLFCGDLASRDSILNSLYEAGKLLTAGNLEDAEQKLTAATTSFNASWNRAGWKWRLFFELGLVHHTAAVFSSAGAAYLILYASFLFERTIPLHVCIYGVCGAALRSLFWLSHQCNRRVLRRVWVVRSLTGPWIAVLLAVVVYLLLKGGLMVLSDEGKAASPNEYAIGVTCLFAGFNWQWALDKLENAFKSKNAKTNS